MHHPHQLSGMIFDELLFFFPLNGGAFCIVQFGLELKDSFSTTPVLGSKSCTTPGSLGNLFHQDTSLLNWKNSSSYPLQNSYTNSCFLMCCVSAELRLCNLAQELHLVARTLRRWSWKVSASYILRSYSLPFSSWVLRLQMCATMPSETNP